MLLAGVKQKQNSRDQKKNKQKKIQTAALKFFICSDLQLQLFVVVVVGVTVVGTNLTQMSDQLPATLAYHRITVEALNLYACCKLR